jgi:dolichyl-phosphate beta-glucosyltransferase
MENKNIKKFYPFIKYCIVGVSGTIIDILSLYILIEFVNLELIPATITAFTLAVINNFIWNKIWTFQNKSKKYHKQFIKFLLVSYIGLLLTVTFMHFFVNVLKIWYIYAKILTSLIVLIWNFFANKHWTFVDDKIVNENSTQSTSKIINYKYYLSIIIPAYNEANRIVETLKKINKYLKEKKLKAEIIVVNDGSQDKTGEIVNNMKKYIKNLKLINLSKNHGKGYAIKQGVMASKSKYLLFTDADNSTPIEELDKLLANCNDNKKIIIGSRYIQKNSIKVKQPWFRTVISRFGNILIRLFLVKNIKDTQCGFKLFESETAKEIFSKQKIKRFAFDMEALAVAQNLGYEIIEIPVTWLHSNESKFKAFKDSVHTLIDLFYIKINLLTGKYKITR